MHYSAIVGEDTQPDEGSRSVRHRGGPKGRRGERRRHEARQQQLASCVVGTPRSRTASGLAAGRFLVCPRHAAKQDSD